MKYIRFIAVLGAFLISAVVLGACGGNTASSNTPSANTPVAANTPATTANTPAVAMNTPTAAAVAGGTTPTIALPQPSSDPSTVTMWFHSGQGAERDALTAMLAKFSAANKDVKIDASNYRRAATTTK